MGESQRPNIWGSQWSLVHWESQELEAKRSRRIWWRGRIIGGKSAGKSTVKEASGIGRTRRERDPQIKEKKSVWNVYMFFRKHTAEGQPIPKK